SRENQRARVRKQVLKNALFSSLSGGLIAAILFHTELLIPKNMWFSRTARVSLTLSAFLSGGFLAIYWTLRSYFSDRSFEPTKNDDDRPAPSVTPKNHAIRYGNVNTNDVKARIKSQILKGHAYKVWANARETNFGDVPIRAQLDESSIEA